MSELPAHQTPARPTVRRWLPLAVIVVLSVAAIAIGLEPARSRSRRWSATTRRSTPLSSAHRIAAVAIYIVVYVVTIALSLPGGLVLTLVGRVPVRRRWSAAPPPAVGATIGATIIFMIAKSAFGEHLARRAGPMAEKLAAGVPRRRVPLSAVSAAGAAVSVLPGQSGAGAGRRARCRPSSRRP